MDMQWLKDLANQYPRETMTRARNFAYIDAIGEYLNGTEYGDEDYECFMKMRDLLANMLGSSDWLYHFDPDEMGG